jgi:hypothetical protein
MLTALRQLGKVVMLPDDDAFWVHCDNTQNPQHSPAGPESEAESQLDFEAAEAIKELLETEVGPEEGPSRVHAQNWDWNDDRRRSVYILAAGFTPGVLLSLQHLLAGRFENFQIIVMLHDNWNVEPWGCILLSRASIALTRECAQRLSIAA